VRNSRRIQLIAVASVVALLAGLLGGRSTRVAPQSGAVAATPAAEGRRSDARSRLASVGDAAATQPAAIAAADASRGAAMALQGTGSTRGAQPAPDQGASHETDAAHASPRAGLRMDPPGAGPGGVTFGVTGTDPAAPRLLTLWRVVDGRSARLAQTQSGSDGRFRFPEVAAGARELAVAAGEEPPGGSAARRSVASEAPPPPLARAVLRADGGAWLRVWPSASAAAVVVSSGGHEVLREAVPALPDARARTLDLVTAVSSPDGTIWIAGEGADGARSRWRRVTLEAPLGGARDPIP
jgi:hypothetical protein